MNSDLRGSELKDLLLWVLRLRRRFRVAGASMYPLLKQGDEVLLDPRAYRQTPPRVGDIVVAIHPFRQDLRIIKRVVGVADDGWVQLQGDNTNSMESNDSRSFGAVSPNQVLGRVSCRLS